jgi:hypothetical protein
MASNCKLFGTAMTRYNEKQLYKKFLDIIEIPLSRLDSSLMEDLRFYARFLVMYATKMKKDWVQDDKSYDGNGRKKRVSEKEEDQAKKDRKACEKKNESREGIS